MFKKVLIANRGEIAVRIIRACREMGIQTVAVYSEADKEALHTQLADESVCIGKAAAKDSYLNMERILSATVIPVGNDLEITFLKKFPLIRALFGSRASINDGIPIVAVLINVSCIGTNGYASPINKNMRASIVEYIVFTKNKDAERCILFIVLLPSATTLGIDAKLESKSTNWATFFVASLPFCIAILQSAAFNAKTSFTPSPVMATVFPLLFSASTNSFF